MGQVLHGKATATHATRAKIQKSEASIATLASHYHINPKTVQKWKNRASVEDLKCGSKPGQNSVLSDLEETLVVEARLKTLLPLDDLFDLLLPLDPFQLAPLPATERHQPVARPAAAGGKGPA